MRLEGHGYEFEAKYYGGPGDGLESTVISLTSDSPSKFSCLELYNLVESKTPLGQHYLQHRTFNQVRVGVYELQNNLDDADELIYEFIGMMNYEDYLQKYGEDT